MVSNYRIKNNKKSCKNICVGKKDAVILQSLSAIKKGLRREERPQSPEGNIEAGYRRERTRGDEPKAVKDH